MQERECDIEILNARLSNASLPAPASTKYAATSKASVLSPKVGDRLICLEAEKQELLEAVDSLKCALSEAVESLSMGSSELEMKTLELKMSKNLVKSLSEECQAANLRTTELEVLYELIVSGLIS